MRKLFELLSNLRQREDGVTGPAMAIIFAAFIVMGSSVAFGVLNTGMFAAQEVTDTVTVSLDSVLGTLEIRGAVTAIDVNGDGAIDEGDHIVFDVRNVAGGGPVLIDPSAAGGSLTINYSDADVRVPGIAYAVTKISGDGDNLLETGELFEITVNPPAGSRLDVNETFDLEIMPPGGAVLIISRTMPPLVDKVTNLH